MGEVFGVLLKISDCQMLGSLSQTLHLQLKIQERAVSVAYEVLDHRLKLH